MSGPRAGPAPVGAHFLSNGSYTALLTARGTGCSAYDGLALTRWAPDAVADRSGWFFYLQDLDTGEVWSASAEPVPVTESRAEPVEVSFTPGRARFHRVHARIAATTEIVVAPDAPAELRRLTLRNAGSTPRRLAVTTWLELVLNSLAADAAHPAFSKLFVQTAYDAEREALLAARRLRSPGEPPLWAGHWLSGPAPLEYETDRARFLGRGRSATSPLALAGAGPLSGTCGNVLDPGFALRRQVTLAPGEQVQLSALLAASPDRAALAQVLDRFRHQAQIARAFREPATVAVAAAVEALALPRAWRARIAFTEDSRTLQAHPPLAPARALAPASAGLPPAAEPGPAEPLQFWNGHGGFSTSGDEYVIRVPVSNGRPVLPPLPWINVLANDAAGCLVSESGAGYTWVENSRENRLTPWSNDPVTDPCTDAVYLRDDDSGEYWSLTPMPAPRAGTYEVRHGFGCTTFRLRSAGDALDHELRVFVPRALPVRVARLRITNGGERARRLSLFSFARLVLGATPIETTGDVVVRHDPGRAALFARNPQRGEFSARVAFSALRTEPAAAGTWTADCASFLGESGDPASPRALREPGGLDGALGGTACFAQQASLHLTPGASVDAVLLLGEARAEAAAVACLEALGSAAAADAALADVVSGWRELLGRIRVTTPLPELDLLANGWAAYQTLACRILGRSALYQSGGAYGFRDQLQDAAALVWLDPSLTRRQLLLHAAHQFVEGDVLHWWHPPLDKGIRTRFSDDLLWLPALAAHYVAATGDRTLLDEVVGFLHAPQLEPGEDERYLVPEPAGEQASVYEHCCRALDRSLATGAHGLPLMGTGDWNDGMNRVGREGQGESVWLGFFLYDILQRFIPLCELRADHPRAAGYLAHQEALGRALNDAGWDGEWYRRAFYDDGAPLGSAASDECRIDAIAQAWAVISGAAPPERAARALDALEEHLVSERAGIIRLLTPAFDRTPHDPGYIKGYLPGVRENGGQYTHGALWAVRALLELGRRERGARLLQLLSPVCHTRTPEEVARYRGEPYVIAADLYGESPHVGRVGWTWYTGSAGWFYRVLLENLLGLELRDGVELALRPCIPDDWPGCHIDYTSPAGGQYHIAMVRAAAGPAHATMDGAPLAVAAGEVRIPLDGGRDHHVEVVLGNDVGPAYRCRLAECADD